jgi:hypothetical protein
VKRTADELEQREKGRIDEERLLIFQQKEAKFRSQQQAELAALLKRIECRRKEHLKQRDLDSKRCVLTVFPRILARACVVLPPYEQVAAAESQRASCAGVQAACGSRAKENGD